jgi:hypothetical protein
MDREAIARIIEPELWAWVDEGKRPLRSQRIERSLDTADAILAFAARSHESERVKGLEEALRRSAEGWANAIELGLLPKQHVLAASILRDEALAALSAIPGEAVLAGEGKGSAGGRVPCPQMDTPTPSPAGGED